MSPRLESLVVRTGYVLLLMAVLGGLATLFGADRVADWLEAIGKAVIPKLLARGELA